MFSRCKSIIINCHTCITAKQINYSMLFIYFVYSFFYFNVVTNITLKKICIFFITLFYIYINYSFCFS